jgi:hypothetical protein
MDEATVRKLFYVANHTTTTFVAVHWDDLADLTQFWLDHHEVETGGQEVWEQKQVEEAEAGNG